jgi:hypothetical protein
MMEQKGTQAEQPQARHGAGSEDRAEDKVENGLEAEQESAAAMDADVPQPPDADHTTEGQPS